MTIIRPMQIINRKRRMRTDILGLIQPHIARLVIHITTLADAEKLISPTLWQIQLLRHMRHHLVERIIF